MPSSRPAREFASESANHGGEQLRTTCPPFGAGGGSGAGLRQGADWSPCHPFANRRPLSDLDSQESAPERTLWTPTSLNAQVRDLLEAQFPSIWIEGELSNVARPASGHLYFTLKDAGAQVRCAMFKPRSNWLPFKPGDGALVLARARVGLYEPRGEFQLVVEHLELAGEGALRRQFEQLKSRLETEGLFDSVRKRPCENPRRIGIGTAPKALLCARPAFLGRRFAGRVEIRPFGAERMRRRPLLPCSRRLDAVAGMTCSC